MARKISDNVTFCSYRIFLIKSRTGYSEFVECESLQDLHKYLALEWIFKKEFSSVVEIKYNGTTPRIKRLSLKEYKTICETETRKKNLQQAIQEIEAFGG